MSFYNLAIQNWMTESRGTDDAVLAYPSVLGVYLHELENLIGPANRQWFLLGIELSESGPNIFFPTQPKRSIVVQLSADCFHDRRRGLWQLAHEAVHLIAPTGTLQASNLEEGLAAWYADKKSDEYGLGFSSDSGPYARPKRSVHELLDINKNSPQKIFLNFRSFTGINTDDIINVIPCIDSAKAEYLCQNFDPSIV
jgi:hypothetical protein